MGCFGICGGLDIPSRDPPDRAVKWLILTDLNQVMYRSGNTDKARNAGIYKTGYIRVVDRIYEEFGRFELIEGDWTDAVLPSQRNSANFIVDWDAYYAEGSE